MTLRPQPSWALLFAAEAAVFGVLDYRDALAQHHWTGASIALGIGFMLTLVAATLGYGLGEALARQRARGRRGAEAALMAAGLALMIWAGVRVARSRAQEAHLYEISTGPVTLEQAQRLAAGSPDERHALAYNRACPPAVLEQLGRSDDWVTRAAVAENPSTPAATLDALARDANDSVRLYLSYNPARKK